MPDELEALLRLVADGKLTPEEAAPLVARLQTDRKAADRNTDRPPDRPAAEASTSSEPESWRTSKEGGRSDGHERHGGRFAGGWVNREPRVQKALADRRLKILVTEDGRAVVNLQMPLAAAGYAIDRIPGLSDDDRIRIAEAIRSGMTGPIIQARDDDDEVRITIE